MTFSPKKVADLVEEIPAGTAGVIYVTSDLSKFHEYQALSDDDVERASTDLRNREKLKNLRETIGVEKIDPLVAEIGLVGVLAVKHMIRCFIAAWKALRPGGRLVVGMTSHESRDPTKLVADMVAGADSFVGYPPWPAKDPKIEHGKLLCYEKGFSKASAPPVTVGPDETYYEALFGYSLQPPEDTEKRLRKLAFRRLMRRMEGSVWDASFGGSQDFRRAARLLGMPCTTIAGKLDWRPSTKPRRIECITISEDAATKALADFENLVRKKAIFRREWHSTKLVLAWLRGVGADAAAEKFIKSLLGGEEEFLHLYLLPIKGPAVIAPQLVPRRVRWITVNSQLKKMFKVRMKYHRERPRRPNMGMSVDEIFKNAPAVSGSEFEKRDEYDD